MLQEVLEYIHNYFIASPNPGTFMISADGFSPLPSLLEGQRIWIVGSQMNDGVYTYHEDGIRDDDDTEVAGLRNETFAGTICALAVPPAVIALSGEIKQWVEKNKDAVTSPFQSESFNGYSYELRSGNSNGGTGQATWRDIYGKQLERWRRPFV